MKKNLYLPIGIDDYKKIKKNFYYVDKTLFLKDIIHSAKSTTFLFTRPRRFGKSLMLSMCKYFFDVNENSKNLFTNTNILKSSDEYESYMNKYNVIHLNLKDMTSSSYDEFVESISLKMSELYIDLLKGYVAEEQKYVKAIIERTSTIVELKLSLYKLSRILFKKNHLEVVILIDEYDSPLENAYTKGYYEEARNFIKDFLGNALKSNNYLYKSIVTGITQIAHSSIFSDLNNFSHNNILSNKEEYFGFKEDDVRKILEYCHFNGDIKEVEKWYGGYNFQKQNIYNPWSILNFISNAFTYKIYWSNTGSYSILKETIKLLKEEVNNDLLLLAVGEKLDTNISDTINYDYISNPINVYSLLLFSGYLTYQNYNSSTIYTLQIVNKEIKTTFNNEIIETLTNNSSFQTLRKIRTSILTKDIDRLNDNLSLYILSNLSYLNLKSENAYQIILVTLTSLLEDVVDVKCESEQGKGRCDIYIKSKDKNNDFTYIIELKYRKNRPSEKELQDACETAYKQILDTEYYLTAKREKAKNVILLGIAFSSKRSTHKYEIIDF